MSDLLKQVSVITKTKDVLVVNKPAGLIVHSDGRTEEPSLCDWIMEEYPDIAGVGEPIRREGKEDIPRPGIVHRLDRETSGVLIIARTQKAYKYIKKQFKEREIDKEYDVFVYEKVTKTTFTIDDPIGRSSGDDFRKYSVPPYVRGEPRSAQTDFVVQAATSEATYLSAYPKTGRTHQIRVHMKSIHHPIVCDSLYASGKECLWGLDRQALHARRITFQLPDGKSISAEADLPTDLQRAKEEIIS
jgi:23S rRNA pseudouridine1911/1915/1917 synthase